MRIFLVRHGDAVSAEDAGSDHDRWLSARGRAAARVLGKLLRGKQVVPDAILCSPLPRAVQTAELLATILDYVGPVTSLRSLEVGHARVTASEIQRAGKSVIAVGHQPSLSALGAHLANLQTFPLFHTAQCCAIEHGKPTFIARADLDLIQPFVAE